MDALKRYKCGRCGMVSGQVEAEECCPFAWWPVYMCAECFKDHNAKAKAEECCKP